MTSKWPKRLSAGGSLESVNLRMHKVLMRKITPDTKIKYFDAQGEQIQKWKIDFCRGLLDTGGNAGRLNSQFFVNVKCGLLPVIHRFPALMSMHHSRPKSVIVIFSLGKIGCLQNSPRVYLQFYFHAS